MAGKSPYFLDTRGAKNQALESIKAICRNKRKIKIKYEEKNDSIESRKGENFEQNTELEFKKIKVEPEDMEYKTETNFGIENEIKTEPDELDSKEQNLEFVKCETKMELVDLKSHSYEIKAKTKVHYPKNWEVMLNNIKQMRKNRDAVVDSQGCERSSDKTAPLNVQRFQTLVSLMLSSQTKDIVTFPAMERLKQHGLTIPSINETSESEIGKLIYPVGFWKKKAEYIKKTSIICHGKYNDDIPDNIKELCSLPGVGPKMAHICMNVAWGEMTGIGVDTHVHRIANKFKWVKTKQPEQTRKALESWLPRTEWDDFNILLVGFGQQTCLAVNPKCGSCLNQLICPASSIKGKRPSKKIIKKEDF